MSLRSFWGTIRLNTFSRKVVRMTDLAKRVDDHVGQQIRKRRNLLGMTQEELARALKISYQQVQKYETGANRVSAGRLYEISEKLGIEVSYFFEDASDATPIEREHGGKTRSTVDLVRSFDEIKSSGLRSALVGLIRELARASAA